MYMPKKGERYGARAMNGEQKSATNGMMAADMRAQVRSVVEATPYRERDGRTHTFAKATARS